MKLLIAALLVSTISCLDQKTLRIELKKTTIPHIDATELKFEEDSDVQIVDVSFAQLR